MKKLLKFCRLLEILTGIASVLCIMSIDASSFYMIPTIVLILITMLLHIIGNVIEYDSENWG